MDQTNTNPLLQHLAQASRSMQRSGGGDQDANHAYLPPRLAPPNDPPHPAASSMASILGTQMAAVQAQQAMQLPFYSQQPLRSQHLSLATNSLPYHTFNRHSQHAPSSNNVMGHAMSVPSPELLMQLQRHQQLLLSRDPALATSVGRSTTEPLALVHANINPGLDPQSLEPLAFEGESQQEDLDPLPLHTNGHTLPSQVDPDGDCSHFITNDHNHGQASDVLLSSRGTLILTRQNAANASPPSPRCSLPGKEPVASSARDTKTQLAPPPPTTSSCSSIDDAASLLHNSCKLYPRTLFIVESALRMDPEAIRRKIHMGCSSGDPSLGSNSERAEGGGESHSVISKRRKVEEKYGYPINIALHHDASDDVIDLLLREGPDVLSMPDGPYESSTLAIAIDMGKPHDLLKRIMKANPRAMLTRDRYDNLPLHSILRNKTSPSLDSVKVLYRAYPKGLRMTNFHGHTPLDLAVRNEVCGEGVLNFLQSVDFKEQEDLANHLDDIVD